jgi:glucan phosphoethanolaminetransferase (alkaline phosphatase superfamily)
MRVHAVGARHTAIAERVAQMAKRWLGCFATLAFALQFVAVELWIRDWTFYAKDPRHTGGLLASAMLMLLIVRSPLARLVFWRTVVAALVGGALIAQLVYYRYYHGPLDAQAALAARHAWADVAPVLGRGTLELGLLACSAAATEYLLMSVAARRSRARANILLMAVAAAGLLLTGGARGMTSELRIAHGVWRLSTTRDSKSVDGRLPLPELESSRAELPNVLFIITESVRASDACQTSGCEISPGFDARLATRTTFEQARSLSSYTAVALSALATGQVQLGQRDRLSRAPDFFDLAHAVRAQGKRYALAYWTSQLAGVFERGSITRVADEVVTAETFLHGPAADIEDAVAALLDRRVAEHCEQRMARLSSPSFVVLHLSGTHAPYAFDDARAPFKPWQRHVTWSGLPALHRAYLNSILEQDRSIAGCLHSFLEHSAGQPWVVIYTSDHGEAFGEHSAIHHGQNLFDEQIRVPLILAHGGDALSPQQARDLHANRTDPVTHLDVLPTLLDVLGLKAHVALLRWANALPGRSLLAHLGQLGAIPITNCTELFPCPINTWGVLGRRTKLVAQAWDGQWRCVALDGSEREIDLDTCTDLRQAACRHFATMPNARRDPFCH